LAGFRSRPGREMVADTCLACAKAAGTLQRCGRCRNAWFCNRKCQLVAVKEQGHSGANCCPAGGAQRPLFRPSSTTNPKAARSPVTDPPQPSSTSCLACDKGGGTLQRCGRCRNAWFCNRECQIVAVNKQGHSGVNCRRADGSHANCHPADGSQRPSATSPKAAHSPVSAPPPSLEDAARLLTRYGELVATADAANSENTRLGMRAAVEAFKEAGSVADLLGCAEGAFLRGKADLFLSNNLMHLDHMPAAARAACSAARCARAAGSRTLLVKATTMCGAVAQAAPDQMVNAEMESRERERRSDSPSYGGPEGRIRLPTTPAALSRLCIAYGEAAVAVCENAPADERAGYDNLSPSLLEEAQARGALGVYLREEGEQHQSVELARQAVALLRRAVTSATRLRRIRGEI